MSTVVSIWARKKSSIQVTNCNTKKGVFNLKSKWFAFVILLMSVVIAVGCMKQQSTTAPTGESPSSNQQQVFQWKMISVWGKGSALFENDQYFVDLLRKLSNGRLDIKLHGVGELAPANQVLDMVSKGTVQLGSEWAGYWTGLNTAFDPLGTQPIGFSNWDYLLWLEEAGGRELFNEMYGRYNGVYFPFAISGMESGIRSNVPIKSLEDVKGKKIRMAGLVPSQLVQELGATPVTLAATELYESLQRGVVDAVEFSSPAVDEDGKIHEVAKYWLTPGFHQTSSIYGVMINKDAWASLPDDLKAVFEEASRSALLSLTAQFTYQDALAADRLVKNGVEVTTLSDSDMQKLYDLKEKIVNKLAEENPDFAKVLKSQQDYLKSYAKYREMQGEWSFGNNKIIID